MGKLMEHELHRWSYMTPPELARRLEKITQLDKLLCFREVARDRDSWLFDLAVLREKKLKGEGVSPSLMKKALPGIPVVPKRKELVTPLKVSGERFVEF